MCYIYFARESMLFCGIQSGCSVFESSYSLHRERMVGSVDL